MDDLATDVQVERMADRVLLRIEERRTQRRAGAMIAVTALLFVGGFGLLLTQLGHGSAGTAGSGGAGSSTADSSSAMVVCHTSSTRTSSTRAVTLKGAPTVRAAVDACADALDQARTRSASGASASAPPASAPPSSTGEPSSGSSTTSGSSTPAGSTPAGSSPAGSSAGDLVACRDGAGRLQVFVKDAHPRTLCARNDLTSP